MIENPCVVYKKKSNISCGASNRSSVNFAGQTAGMKRGMGKQKNHFYVM